MCNCIWNCKVEDRHCELCLYCGECERKADVSPQGDSVTESYINIMNTVVGSDIRAESRMMLVRWGRYFVMYQLRAEGYSFSRIGEILNRDHATVSHGVKCVSLALDNPKQYPDVMPIWNSFTEKLSLHKTITV